VEFVREVLLPHLLYRCDDFVFAATHDLPVVGFVNIFKIDFTVV
jgi:hypothetical protein